MIIKRKINNSYGFSLITALIGLSLVTLTISYMVSLSKNATLTTASTRTTTLLELEKKRIASVLTDNDICKLNTAFGGKPPLRSNINEIVIGMGGLGPIRLITSLDQPDPAFPTVISKRINRYHNGILTVASIHTKAIIDPSDPLMGTSRGYYLQINYSDTASVNPNERINYTGRNNASIIIPMYMKLDGSGNVEECYALTLNSEIDKAINASCSPDPIGAPVCLDNNKNSLLTKNADGSNIDCQHSVTFNNVPVPDLLKCDSTPISMVPSKSTLLNNWKIVGRIINFSSSDCSGISSQCLADESSFDFLGSNLSCGFAGGHPKDSPCAPGQILYHSAGSNTVCTTVTCPLSETFIQRIDPTGATCYKAPTTTCASDEYVKIFNENGSDVCAKLPVMSGACGPDEYGKSLIRDNATQNGTVSCSPYFKEKRCGPTVLPNRFATSFGPSLTVACQSF